MSNPRRLLFGPLSAFVIVMLLAGMLYAPTALANAESDNGKGKGNSNTNHNSNTNNNGNQNNNGEKDDNKGKGNGGEKDNDNNKCKKHKYDGECDNKKPEIEIDSPGKHSKIGSSITVNGQASDSGSGIHDVEVKVDGKAFSVVSTHSGAWTFTTSGLHHGHHLITAKATDNAHNIARTHISINVV